MEIISSIFDGIDKLGNLVPALDKLVDGIGKWVSIFLMLGPVCMLVLGLIYLFLPPKEANHHIGYCTFFGMGSVEAWKHAQKIAGFVYCGASLLLGIAMGLICLSLGDKDNMQMCTTAISSLIVQIAVILLIYLFMFVYTAIVFDRHGNRRKDKKNA